MAYPERSSPDFLPRLLLYLLQTSAFQIDNRATGDIVSFLNKSDVKNHLSTNHPGTLFPRKTTTEPTPVREGPAPDITRAVPRVPGSNGESAVKKA